MAAFAQEDEDALFHSYLWRLNIGAEHQGKGYGRFAVEALCQEAMRRGQHRLTVCYHPYSTARKASTAAWASIPPGNTTRTK